jgi:hypothetical protein
MELSNAVSSINQRLLWSCSDPKSFWSGWKQIQLVVSSPRTCSRRLFCSFDWREGHMKKTKMRLPVCVSQVKKTSVLKRVKILMSHVSRPIESDESSWGVKRTSMSHHQRSKKHYYQNLWKSRWAMCYILGVLIGSQVLYSGGTHTSSGAIVCEYR